MPDGQSRTLAADDWRAVALDHEGRIASVEQRLESAAASIADLHDTVRWVLRTSVGTLVAVIGALLTVLFGHVVH